MTCSCETWLIHVRHDSFTWDMTHSRETWLIHIRHCFAITHDSFAWHDSFIYISVLLSLMTQSSLLMTHSRNALLNNCWITTWVAQPQLHMRSNSIRVFEFFLVLEFVKPSRSNWSPFICMCIHRNPNPICMILLDWIVFLYHWFPGYCQQEICRFQIQTVNDVLFEIFRLIKLKHVDPRA